MVFHDCTMYIRELRHYYVMTQFTDAVFGRVTAGATTVAEYSREL
jgi:hypothetical protein